MFDLIALDADDTLWQNEKYYRLGRERFCDILRPYGLDGDLEAVADTVEIANLPHYGYGVMSFTLSLIEAAVDLTDGRLAAADVAAMLEMGKAMLRQEVELLDDAAEVVARLATTYPLMLITKGDLQHQWAKVRGSGLAGHFRHVEVVSDKTPEIYAGILRRHAVAPDRFLMVGNSMRSDILPVISLGAWAIHVTDHLTWAHEAVAAPPALRRHYHEVERLSQVPPLIDRLAAG